MSQFTKSTFQAIKVLVKLEVTLLLALMLAGALEAIVVLPLASAIYDARLTAPPAGTWFEGNNLDFGYLDFLRTIAVLLPMVPPFLWVLSRLMIPNKDRRFRLGALSAVCFLVFGISVALQATLAPAHQYQASSEGITFPNASSSRGPLKWSDVTSIELACIYHVGGRYSPGWYEPSLVLNFGSNMALDVWEGARRANSLTSEKTYVEGLLHHFDEVVARLPPAALANTVHHNGNCQRDFKELQRAMIGSAQHGNP